MSLSFLIWQKKNVQQYKNIPFNELLHARNDVPDDICQFVRNTAIIMFEAHGGDTFYAEFDGTRSVKVRTECSDGTDNKVIASCTKMGAFTPTLQNTTVVCTRG